MQVDVRALKVRWIDADPGGPHRASLAEILAPLPVEVRTGPEPRVDDDALVLVDPQRPAAADEALCRHFRATGRPTATIRPAAAARPADLLITVFDGLLAQLGEDRDPAPFDDVLLALLRLECSSMPQRYAGWLLRALVNAGLTRLYEGETAVALSLLGEATTLGPPPDELLEVSEEVAEALVEASATVSEDREALLRVQDWLLLNTD